jgi:uncharacterized protein (DUF362 family)
MSSGISRRRFVKLLGGAAAAIGLASLGYSLGWFTAGERAVLERSISGESNLERPLVSLVKGRDVDAMVRRAIKVIGGIEALVSPGSRILIKPNVGFNRPEAVTSPEVLRAVIEVVKDADPKEIIVAESAVRGYNTSNNFGVTGIADVVRGLGIRLVDLDKSSEIVKVKTSGKLLGEVSVFKLACDADVIISVPRLKRHSQAIVTISMKNMMGILPSDQKGMFHVLGLQQCIADLNTVFRPDLAIVDATEVMTVSGPGMGRMVPGEAILASRDPVALDLIAAEYLFRLEGNENPLETALNVPHIKLAAELGIGINDPSRIRVVEERVS